MTSNPDAIIVGAGPAGLACAVTMHAAGLDATVLEKADRVGAVWRQHYDRLHLHTDRNHSGQPDMAMPRAFPAYPSRAQMVHGRPSKLRGEDPDRLPGSFFALAVTFF